MIIEKNPQAINLITDKFKKCMNQNKQFKNFGDNTASEYFKIGLFNARVQISVQNKNDYLKSHFSLKLSSSYDSKDSVRSLIKASDFEDKNIFLKNLEHYKKYVDDVEKPSGISFRKQMEIILVGTNSLNKGDLLKNCYESKFSLTVYNKEATNIYDKKNIFSTDALNADFTKRLVEELHFMNYLNAFNPLLLAAQNKLTKLSEYTDFFTAVLDNDSSKKQDILDILSLEHDINLNLNKITIKDFYLPFPNNSYKNKISSYS